MLDHDQIDRLDADRDKPAVYAWLRAYLRWHLAVWSNAVGLGWDEAAIDEHLDAFDLVEREWQELVRAAEAEDRLVAVARESARPVGILYAEEREERYLRVPMGVISWIFVEPVSRGTGVSRMLMAAAAEWMRERGLSATEVFVTADNPAAVQLYKRFGYRVIDHRMLGHVAGRPPG